MVRKNERSNRTAERERVGVGEEGIGGGGGGGTEKDRSSSHPPKIKSSFPPVFFLLLSLSLPLSLSLSLSFSLSLSCPLWQQDPLPRYPPTKMQRPSLLSHVLVRGRDQNLSASRRIDDPRSREETRRNHKMTFSSFFPNVKIQSRIPYTRLTHVCTDTMEKSTFLLSFLARFSLCRCETCSRKHEKSLISLRL